MSRDIKEAAREIAGADAARLALLVERDPDMIRDVAACALSHLGRAEGVVPRLVEQRQIWIGERLSEVGTIRRRDICDRFGISIPQASSDLSRYQTAHPGAIIYDKTARCYRVKDRP